jgi:hypothetical protein
MSYLLSTSEPSPLPLSNQRCLRAIVKALSKRRQADGFAGLLSHRFETRRISPSSPLSLLISRKIAATQEFCPPMQFPSSAKLIIFWLGACFQPAKFDSYFLIVSLVSIFLKPSKKKSTDLFCTGRNHHSTHARACAKKHRTFELVVISFVIRFDST